MLDPVVRVCSAHHAYAAQLQRGYVWLGGFALWNREKELLRVPKVSLSVDSFFLFILLCTIIALIIPEQFPSM